jgi:uncharacterized iron-regulated protein
LALLALLLPALGACARPAPTDQPMAVSFLPAPGELITAAGDRLPPEAFAGQAAQADYILIGESHANPCDHEAERRLVDLLAAAGPLAVGLEMTPAANTPVLREFLDGRIAPEDLATRLDWERTWGHPFRFYLPVFTALRDGRIPAAGLNVPPEVIRRLSAAALDPATAADPVAALPEADRKLLPARVIPPAPEQLALLREVMDGHPGMPGQKKNAPADPAAQAEAKALEERRFARFTLIQSVWDTAMAEAAVRLRAQSGRRVAVLAGTGHVDAGLGIARRLAVLDPGARVLLVSPWRGDDFDPADAAVRFYCPIGFESRLGMTIENRPSGGEAVMVVAEVKRGSRAESAGLRPGDVVERAGSYRMRTLMALHLAGSDAHRENAPLMLTVRRGAELLRVDLGRLSGGKPGSAAPAQTAPAQASPRPQRP